MPTQPLAQGAHTILSSYTSKNNLTTPEVSRHQLKAHTMTSHKVCMQMMREPSVLNACFCSNDSEAKLLFAAEHSCVARTFAKFKNMPAESIQVRWCFRYGAQHCSLLPWKRIVNTAACVILPLSESGSGWPLYGTAALQHHIHRFEQLKISLFVASGTRHSSNKDPVVSTACEPNPLISAGCEFMCLLRQETTRCCNLQLPLTNYHCAGMYCICCIGRKSSRSVCYWGGEWLQQ